MEGETETTGKGKSASFCIPRAAIKALLDAKANTYEICAYLILARFTDPTGVYSTASRSAVERYTGASKRRDGPVDRAIERLKTIRATKTVQVPNGRSGKSHAMVTQSEDLGPILYDRDSWLVATGELLEGRDGPTERGAVAYVLPTLGESVQDRVWIGGGLVDGFGEFAFPLKKIRNGGDAAARLLLAMYAATDMETWGGVDPHHGPWRRYERTEEDCTLSGGARLIRAKSEGTVATVAGNMEEYWEALALLESTGLFYEAVLVLNRNAEKATFRSGAEYGAIPKDAEPYYELDARSDHGYKPAGEEGLGGITADTAGKMGRPVTITGGVFNGTYAAIVPRGQGAMVAGIFRPRFRVANPKNAGVKSAWARIQEGNAEALGFVNAIRSANKLDPMPAPWDVAKGKRLARSTGEAALVSLITAFD